MSLQSYEAIYHQGQIKGLGDCPQVEEARVVVTVLSSEIILSRFQPVKEVLTLLILQMGWKNLIPSACCLLQ